MPRRGPGSNQHRDKPPAPAHRPDPGKEQLERASHTATADPGLDNDDVLDDEHPHARSPVHPDRATALAASVNQPGRTYQPRTVGLELDNDGFDRHGRHATTPAQTDTDQDGHPIEGPSLAGADLEAADLQGHQLAAADFAHANLDDATLQHANLTAARLHNTSAICCDLRHANMTGARLDNVDLSSALCDHANLTGARLDNVTIDAGTTLHRANLTGTVITNLTVAPHAQQHVDRTDLHRQLTNAGATIR